MAVNYANRNASGTMSDTALAGTYAVGVTAACGYVQKQLIRPATPTPHSTHSFLIRTITFLGLGSG